MRLISAICDFIQHARTAVSRGTAIANSQCDFSRNVICNFFGFLVLMVNSLYFTAEA